MLGDLLGKGYTVRNYGVKWRTLLKNGDRPYWKLGAFKQATDFGPNVVILKLGTNDTKPQNWGKHGKEYQADCVRWWLISRACPLSRRSIYVCRHPSIRHVGVSTKNRKEA